MTISAEAFGQDALQFIGDLDRLSTTEAVAEGMGRITSRFGFQALFIGGHKAHHGSPSRSFSSQRNARPSFSGSITRTAIFASTPRSSARSVHRKRSISRQSQSLSMYRQVGGGTGRLIRMRHQTPVE